MKIDIRFAVALQYRLEAALITVCADCMSRCHVAFRLLKNVGDESRSELLKLVAFLLTFPFFELGNLLFKVVYTLQQRRLRRVCSENTFLKFYDSRIPSGRRIHVLHGLRDIHHRLERAYPAKDLSDHLNTPI